MTNTLVKAYPFFKHTFDSEVSSRLDLFISSGGYMKFPLKLLIVFIELTALSLYAHQEVHSSLNSEKFALMTAKDIHTQSSSGVSIKNINSSGSITVNALYLQSISSCGTETTCGDWHDNELNLLGSMWTPVTVSGDQTVNIGSNYLYNMMMNYTYDVEVAQEGAANGSLTRTPGMDDVGPNWKIKLGLTTQAAMVETGATGGSDLVTLEEAVFIIVTCNNTTQICTKHGSSPGSRQDFD